MIDPSRVEAGGPLRYSSSSEGPELQELVDSQLPPLPQDHDDGSHMPHSPRSTFRSSNSLIPAAPHEDADSGQDRSQRRSHRKSGDSHRSSANLIKTFVNERFEDARTKKYIRMALDRLDSETRRAQEAERRALELAERFRLMNESRMQVQNDLNRANEELRLHKFQLEHAERELQRGQNMLTTVEQQRDDAERSAAHARDVARRLKEEKLVRDAREEGHRQGFEEGLRQAREELRATGYRRTRSGTQRTIDDVIDEDEEEARAAENMTEDQAEYLDDLPELQDLPNRMPPPSRGRRAPGSRFREHGISPSTTNASLYPAPERPPPAVSQPVAQDPPIVHPSPRYNTPMHPETYPLPDGYIPSVDREGSISLPPPHEIERAPPSPNFSAHGLPIPEPQTNIRVMPVATPEPVMRDYTYPKGRTSPGSLVDSIPSTTFSQFDLVNPDPKTAARNFGRDGDLRDRNPALSVIHEVSSEYGGTPSPGMPEPVMFPTAASPAPGSSWGTSTATHVDGRSPTPRNRQANQRLADELRYGNPDIVEEWRNSASESLPSKSSKRSLRHARPANVTVPSPLSHEITRSASALSNRSRPRSPLGGRPISPRTLQVPHRPSSARPASDRHSRGSDQGRNGTESADISINIEPPSGSGSEFSPVAQSHSGMLSPNSAHEPLPPPQRTEIPTVPNSPSTQQRYPSMGILPTEPGGPPLGFMPTGPPAPYPNIIPGGPGVIPPPLAQSSPRQRAQSIYSGLSPSDPRSGGVPIQRSASAASSRGYGSQMRSGHSRVRSIDSVGTGHDARPASAMSLSPPQQACTPSQSMYQVAPTPPGVQYPLPPVERPDPRSMSPASITSRLSAPGQQHHRSLSLNAGSTPAASAVPLSTASPPKLRRVPSSESVNSATSRRSYSHYQPKDYVDPAFLASSDDLANVQSPMTAANTRANAGMGAAAGGPSGRVSPAVPNVSALKARKRKGSGRPR